MSDVKIHPIDPGDHRLREAFLRFPWMIYPRSSPWCPPLLSERRSFLDPARNPFFSHAAVQLFLAYRAGVAVGRIAACEDRLSNDFHRERVVNFGFFESIDDDDVAGALLDAVAAWGRQRGLLTMRGPASFNSNHDYGLLLSGFDAAPVVGMPYNPEYYVRLLERQQMQKAKDLYAWWLSLEGNKASLARLDAIAARLQRRARVRLRTIDLARWHEELELARDLYNDAWKSNWSFVPVSTAEFAFLAKELRHFVVPELAFIAECDGYPVALSLTVLDANHAVRRANGRLFPFGFAKIYRAFRRIDVLRLLLLGVRDGYRLRGIETLFYIETFRAARDIGRFKGGEIGWTLEDNDFVNRAIEVMGGTLTKIYRVYERRL